MLWYPLWSLAMIACNSGLVCLQVRIDNDRPDHTVLIIDSANRPGTLVEVRRSFVCLCLEFASSSLPCHAIQLHNYTSVGNLEPADCEVSSEGQDPQS